MKKTLVVGGLAAIVLGCLFATAPGNADNQGDSAVSAPFKGGIIVVGSKVTPEAGVILENAKIQRLGDKYFVVGIGVDYGHPDDWMKGRVVWNPLDDVNVITEFPNVDEYKKAPNGPARQRAKEPGI